MLRRLFRLTSFPLRCLKKPNNQPLKPFNSNLNINSQMRKDLEKQSRLNDNDNQETQEQQKRDGAASFYVMAGGIMCIGLAFFYLQLQEVKSKSGEKKKNNKTNFSVGKADIGGQWRLTTTDGTPFGSDNLKGKYYIIYFGFCNCPDICPNAMTKMKKAIKLVKQQKESSFFKLEYVFVSVDPDRDSLKDIKKFTNYFDKNFIGVTGTSNNDPDLLDCMRKFKIYASRIDYQQQTPQGKEIKAYSLDHTIINYLISDTNQYITHLGSNLSDADLAKQILQNIQADQKSKFNRIV